MAIDDIAMGMTSGTDAAPPARGAPSPKRDIARTPGAAPPSRPRPIPRLKGRDAAKKIFMVKKQKQSLKEVSEILVGLTADEVSLLLGPAKSSTVLMPSKIVEYRFPKCHLKLHFYPDVLTEVFRVLRIEARPAAQNRKSLPYCAPEHLFPAAFDPYT